VKNINAKSKTLILISIVACALIAGSLILIAQSTVKADTSSTSDNTTSTAVTNDSALNVTGNGFPGGFGFGDRMFMGGHGGPDRGFGGFGQVQVSSDFTQNVTNIANNDSDVQNLLNSGYNITSVRPIISTVIDGNGNVVTKATSAVLMLEKDTTGRAMVLVDLTQAKVTHIETITRTVIDKP
jgi:hypothetical protein